MTKPCDLFSSENQHLLQKGQGITEKPAVQLPSMYPTCMTHPSRSMCPIISPKTPNSKQSNPFPMCTPSLIHHSEIPNPYFPIPGKLPLRILFPPPPLPPRPLTPPPEADPDPEPEPSPGDPNSTTVPSPILIPAAAVDATPTLLPLPPDADRDMGSLPAAVVVVVVGRPSIPGVDHSASGWWLLWL